MLSGSAGEADWLVDCCSSTRLQTCSTKEALARKLWHFHRRAGQHATTAGYTIQHLQTHHFLCETETAVACQAEPSKLSPSL